MRRFARVSFVFLGALAALVAVFFVFLQIWYGHLSRKSMRSAEKLSGISMPPDILYHNAGAAPEVNLLPYPASLELSDGEFVLPEKIAISAPAEVSEDVIRWTGRLLNLPAILAPGALVRCVYENGLPAEGYVLDIGPRSVAIHYGTPAGLYYALVSFKQLAVNYRGRIPCMRIEDRPSLPVRGVMLDISRDKVPQLSTLFRIVDYLSDLKINHVQLYVEGFSFGYPSYRHLWEGLETPIGPEEIRALDVYCRDRFVDLGANHNILGHMAAWLATDEFADLAECPEGYNLNPFIRFKTTIDPYDPRSLELVQQMTADLLPNFSSNIFNVNLDEPFELGKCKNRNVAKMKGVEGIYLDYALRIHDMVKTYGREIWMWGDILARHPELAGELPEDITVLEWGYEYDHPFESRCERLAQMDRPFLVCPGTSSWTSLGGRTENMLANIDVAIRTALKYGARGMLLTDWGDMGHWQYLPISYTGFAWGAAQSWNPDGGHTVLLERHLSNFAFRDSSEIMGGLVMDLGRYNQFEEFPIPNMTLCMLVYQLGIMDRVMAESIVRYLPESFRSLVGEDMIHSLSARFEQRQNFRYHELKKYLEELSSKLRQSHMNLDDADLMVSEFENAMSMIGLGADLRHFIIEKQHMGLTERKVMLESMLRQTHEIERQHRALWLARNKPGGLDRSLQSLLKVREQIEGELKKLDRSGFVRAIDRLAERAIAAAAAIYFN